MSLLDTKLWITIADEDLEISLILNNHHKKHLEAICYHCAQATEKYLKGFLSYNDINPEKTHDLEKLLLKCISLNQEFACVKRECKIINKFTNEIRYPYRFEVSEAEVNYILKSVEKIKKLEVFNQIRREIAQI